MTDLIQGFPACPVHGQTGGRIDWDSRSPAGWRCIAFGCGCTWTWLADPADGRRYQFRPATDEERT